MSERLSALFTPGDYVLALKENHPTLHEALEAETSPAEMRRHVTTETNRGREERREYIAMPAPKTLPGFAAWASLATLVMVIRITRVGEIEKGEVSYYVSSLPPKVKTLAKLIRQHWSIESQLHWVLDVTFTEDQSRIRKHHAPQTSAMLRRLAVSILSSDTSKKGSLRGKRYRACLSTDVLERICREIRCDCRAITTKSVYVRGVTDLAGDEYGNVVGIEDLPIGCFSLRLAE